MYTVTPSVTYHAQVTPYDCWHASLRMMVQWPKKSGTEPRGTTTHWLYVKCQEGRSGFEATRKRLFEQSKDAREKELLAEESEELRNMIVERYSFKASQEAKGVVKSWAKVQALTSNGQKFKPFSERPGLTLALLPAILAENGLRAVRGDKSLHIVEELADDASSVEQMLKTHGPLYCLVDFGHVVVVVGIKDDESLLVYDPQAPKSVPDERGLKSLAQSPCVARLL